MPTDRIYPNDLDAEQATLGSMICNRDAIGEVLSILPVGQGKWFYSDAHNIVFDAIVELTDQNKPIDLYVMLDYLRSKKSEDKCGGQPYLIELSRSIASANNAAYYAGIVRDKAMRRRLLVAAEKITISAFDITEPVSDVLDGAEQIVLGVTEQRVGEDAEPIASIADDVFKSLEDRKAGNLRGVQTGLRELDDITQGLQPANMIIVAGRPSSGKTALAMNIAERVAVDGGLPVLVFSLEMAKLELGQRMVCNRAGVESFRVRNGTFSQADTAHMLRAIEDMKRAQLFIDDNPMVSVMDIRARSRRMAKQYGIQAVFVDYLQLVRGQRSENRQQEVASISRGLKAIAKELDIPVVVCAQLNRAVEGRDKNEPRLSDLRESGSIEQDADVVCLLHRPIMYDPSASPTLATLIIAKQRNGPVGKFNMHFQPSMMRFSNWSSDTPESPLPTGIEPDFVPYDPPPATEDVPF